MMTKDQEKILERLRADILNHDGLGPRFVDDHEYKKWEVREHTSSIRPRTLVFLYAVVGRKGDEGTWNEVLGRTYRHIEIGPKGGVKALRGRKVSGYRKVILLGYEH